jgi:hypothetical protein
MIERDCIHLLWSIPSYYTQSMVVYGAMCTYSHAPTGDQFAVSVSRLEDAQATMDGQPYIVLQADYVSEYI